MTDSMTFEATLEGEPVLSDEQRARALALGFARATLSDSSTGPVGLTSDSLAKRFTSQDVIDVAEWIVNGTDPMDKWHEHNATPKDEGF